MSCIALQAYRRFGETYTSIFRLEVLNRYQTERKDALALKSALLWIITPCSPLRVNDVSEEHIASRFRVVFQRTTRRYIPEDDTLQNHRCENLKSSICLVVWLTFRLLEIETQLSSETSVNLYQTARRHIPIYCTLKSDHPFPIR
jgi:hypothetical protein